MTNISPGAALLAFTAVAAIYVSWVACMADYNHRVAVCDATGLYSHAVCVDFVGLSDSRF